jgi:hypothetical protein
MVAKLFASLKTDMPLGVERGISGEDIHNIVDTFDCRSFVSVKQFGAVLDGATDDTAAWNAALASGRNIYFPEGESRITNQVNFSNVRGQILMGAGNNASEFKIDSGFNMAASSVIRIVAIAQQIVNVGIWCTQPSTNNRNSLVKYPWVIDATNCPSTELHNVWINNSWNGVRLHDNCGQSIIDRLKVGGFNCDLHVDGSVDTVRIDHYHSWPLDFAGDANLMSIYSDRSRIAAEFGRVDDLDIGSMLTFEGRILFGNLSGLGHPFGVASRIALDGTGARIEMTAGRMAIASVYGTGGVLNDFKISVSNTSGLVITALYLFVVGSTDPQSWVYVNGPSASLTIAAFLCEFNGNSRLVACDNGGTLTLSNGTFVQSDAVARTQPVIQVNSGRAVITGCQMRASGAGTGTFIQVVADDRHAIVGNNFNTWTYLLPTDQTLGTYRPNAGVPPPPSGSTYQGALTIKTFTGTLNGSGVATIAHGTPLVHTRLVSVSAAYTGGVGERVPFQPASVDGTNISLDAGAGGASRAYSVWLQYT